MCKGRMPWRKKAASKPGLARPEFALSATTEAC